MNNDNEQTRKAKIRLEHLIRLKDIYKKQISSYKIAIRGVDQTIAEVNRQITEKEKLVKDE